MKKTVYEWYKSTPVAPWELLVIKCNEEYVLCIVMQDPVEKTTIKFCLCNTRVKIVSALNSDGDDKDNPVGICSGMPQGI